MIFNILMYAATLEKYNRVLKKTIAVIMWCYLRKKYPEAGDFGIIVNSNSISQINGINNNNKNDIKLSNINNLIKNKNNDNNYNLRNNK